MLNPIIWGLIAALGAAAWNLVLVNSNKNILDNSDIKSLYLRIIIVIAGLISLITLFLPKIGINKEKYDIIKKNTSIYYILFASVVFIGYQLLLIYAFSSGGATAAALINLNIIFMIIYGIFFNKSRVDFYLWIFLIIYTIFGILINWYKHKYL